MIAGGPLVSIVIPVYRQARFLGEAVSSALRQTYASIEVIVVDDASPDAVDDVMAAVDDPRVTCIKHDVNRGLPAARNTGILASHGELVALLDADDFFHPAKIQTHVGYLRAKSEVGLTYSARFNLNCGSRTVREIWSPPAVTDLHDFVQGFPFAPSDVVIRRAWLDRVGLFDESLQDYSEDLDLHCKLGLAGCLVAGLRPSLTYRRHHAGRVVDVTQRHRAAVTVLERAFQDPRCPESVRQGRSSALASHAQVWAWQAYAQRDTACGSALLREACRLKPALLGGSPPQVLEGAVTRSLFDATVDHAALLDSMLGQLPGEFLGLLRHRDRAVAQGYARRAMRALFFESDDDPRWCLDQAARLGFNTTEEWIQGRVAEALVLRENWGTDAADRAIAKAARLLTTRQDRAGARRLTGAYAFNLAVQDYRRGRHREALSHVAGALVACPDYLRDRGLLSIGLRSLLPPLRRPAVQQNPKVT